MFSLKLEEYYHVAIHIEGDEVGGKVWIGQNSVIPEDGS